MSQISKYLALTVLLFYEDEEMRKARTVVLFVYYFS